MFLPFSAFTQENDKQNSVQTDAQPGTPERPQETLIEQMEHIQLLEFLGEFETADGQWVNPEDLLGQAYSGLGDTVRVDDE